ncbi:olfactory receptor 56A5-like [Protopterus annectens]|uniref:olfactory receptor 56A5-like n=1 Tax=Protopterus annectens TaxID=7888 RepID=UPI001CFB9264|nr:olfactory receptor 56A5-like [Protopterus annectens]
MSNLDLILVMSSNNNTEPSEFILIGFPGLQKEQKWLSIPFCILLLIAVFGNVTVIFIISKENTLHKPMYIFISFLAVIDLVPTISLLPNLLLLVMFELKNISFTMCFMQMFLIGFSATMESSMLLLMAYDRYIAVSNPLNYASLITNSFVCKWSLILCFRSLLFSLPLPILARILSYCSYRTISNCYCSYTTVTKIACNNYIITTAYSFFLTFAVAAPDTILIILSYYRIAKAAINLKSADAMRKVLSTCSSHLFVILFFYATGILSVVVNLFEKSIPFYISVLSSVLYIVIPPAINPVIYSVRTKEVRIATIKHFKKIMKLPSGKY